MEALENAAQNQIAPAGPHCVVSGDIVRPRNSQMEIQMLENVPPRQTVLNGLRIVPNLDIARKMEELEMLEPLEREEEVGFEEVLEMELELEVEMELELELMVELELELEPVEVKVEMVLEVEALVNVAGTLTVQERLHTAPSGATADPRQAMLTEAQDPRLIQTPASVELTPTVLTGLPTAHSLDSAEKPQSLAPAGLDKHFYRLVSSRTEKYEVADTRSLISLCFTALRCL